MNNRMKTVFSALAENEAFARSAAAAFVMPLDPTVEELTEIKTAVSEAVSNSVIHGYSGWEDRSQAMVELECEINGNWPGDDYRERSRSRNRQRGESHAAAVFYSGKRRALRHGIYGNGKLYGQAAGDVRGRERDCRDDDEISGSGQCPINMYRLLRRIHTN